METFMSLLNIKSIAPDAELSVAIALHFAKLSLPIWKESYPNDSRPEDAIKAAEHYVSTGANAAAAYAAANAAHAAGDAADAAAANAASYAGSYAGHAAYAAANAAYAAANAASYYADNAASYAGSYAGHAAGHAAYAAFHAASAANATCTKSFIHLELRKQLSGILSYKVKKGQSFGEPDAVFENLAESDAKLFLFNLDSLR